MLQTKPTICWRLLTMLQQQFNISYTFCLFSVCGRSWTRHIVHTRLLTWMMSWLTVFQHHYETYEQVCSYLWDNCVTFERVVLCHPLISDVELWPLLIVLPGKKVWKCAPMFMFIFCLFDIYLFNSCIYTLSLICIF